MKTRIFPLILATILAGCGGGGGSSSASSGGATTPTPPVVPGPPAITVLAGNMGGSGFADGAGANARFAAPKGIAVDVTGNVYVTDAGNDLVRKITPGGVVSTLPSDGFFQLLGITTDKAGNVYVNNPLVTATSIPDEGVYIIHDQGDTVLQFTPSGSWTTLAGSNYVTGAVNGIGAAASFNILGGAATDSAGNIYVVDTGNQLIRKITPNGLVSTFAGTSGIIGSADGAAGAASFNNPSGIAIDTADNVYVTDMFNGTIRKITAAGVVSTLAGKAGVVGSADGTGAAASFGYPSTYVRSYSGFLYFAGLAVDGAGNVYVADFNNNAIRKITPAGVVTTLAAATFNQPNGVAIDSAGNIYVADTGNSIVRKITPSGAVSTFAGAMAVTGSADGTGAAASFSALTAVYNDIYAPAAVAADSAGNVFLADIGNSTIRKITSAGVTTTIAGTPGAIGNADGTGAAASFNTPDGVAVDGTGNLYVADTGNHSVRKITPAGVVSTLAGGQGSGIVDGTGAAAKFVGPSGIVVDSAGNIFVSDYSVIRKITPAGAVSTIAGTAGASGNVDATGTAAIFGGVTGIAIDKAGNLYVADTINTTVRKITAAGVVSTMAGNTQCCGPAVDGTGSAAKFGQPIGIAVDGTGNLYVTDKISETIRKVTPAGVVTTVAGVGQHAGFTAGPLPGYLSEPMALSLSGTSLYVTTAQGVAVITNVP